MTLEDLIELARENLTPEQEGRLKQAARNHRMRELEREMTERSRCPECGVDTIRYSHTFRCYYRGL